MKKILFLITLCIANILLVNSVKADELIKYQTQIQNIGWQGEVKDGETSGTVGRALRLEAIKINLSPSLSGDIIYKTHVSYQGWQNEVKNGEMSGTVGRSARLEAITIRLDGAIASEYDIYYRTQVQNVGWQKWVKNGAIAGTEGRSLRLESIQIKLVSKLKKPELTYQTHSSGSWQDYVTNGNLSGSVGKGIPIDVLKVKLELPDNMSGSIEYQSYITPDGWLGAVQNDNSSGTENKNMEAVKIYLTGDIAKEYDVYYCIHVQNMGTLGWAKNGEVTGTIGYFRAIEGITIKLVLKDTEEIKQDKANFFRSINEVEYQSHISYAGWEKSVKDGATSSAVGKNRTIEAFKVKLNTKVGGGVSYRAYVAKRGWQGYVSNNSQAGTSGIGRNIEAIQIRLDGEISNYYDIYYRTHVSNIGWLGWAKNDQKSGSVGNGTKIEAFEVKLVKKGLVAPGPTNNSYVTGSWTNNHTNYYNAFGTKLTGFQFIDGLKYYFNKHGKLMGTDVRKVIDVSSWQGDINWKTIKSDEDVDEVIIRMGYGMSYDDDAQLDSKFDDYIKGVQSNNIPYSLYFYSYARVERAAKKEANFVKQMMKKYGIPKSTFVWYDVEEGYDVGTYKTVIKTFMDELNSNSENFRVPNAGVYGNLSDLTTGGLAHDDIRNKYPIWVAQFYSELQYGKRPYKGWQFSSTERVNGVPTVVDVSMFKNK